MAAPKYYGWISAEFHSKTFCSSWYPLKMVVWKTSDEKEVVICGVTNDPALPTVHWKDKICVGEVESYVRDATYEESRAITFMN